MRQFSLEEQRRRKRDGDREQQRKRRRNATEEQRQAPGQVACVQTSPISFHPRKRDVCETASLIVFQYPAVFQEFVERAFIGCLTIATVRNNSDWLRREMLEIMYAIYI